MEQDKSLLEAKVIDNPTLFICLGVSGAGLTTALNQLINDKFVQLAPAQFSTRSLRANETRGKQFYQVTKDILAKIPQQIAVQDTFYNHEYGFFHPAIRKIERILTSKRNVIADVCNPPSDWQKIINNKFPITSLFFAPQHPFICIDRILARSKQLGENLTAKDLIIRANENAKNISRIFQYDYWIDTTEFNHIFPLVRSIVEVKSFQSSKVDLSKHLVKENPTKITKLIEAFSINAQEYINSKLSV